MSYIGTIYSHIKTGIPYRILTVSRCVKNPSKYMIVYEQIDERNKRANFPRGAVWTRESNDFFKNFKRL